MINCPAAAFGAQIGRKKAAGNRKATTAAVHQRAAAVIVTNRVGDVAGKDGVGDQQCRANVA